MNMKKMITLATAVLLTAAIAVPAMAGNDIKSFSAELRPDITIVVDGTEANFKTSSGEAVYPILVDGSTYLPLRAIGELMGKNVNWDETTKTITISGDRTSISSNKENPDRARKDIQVQERRDFTIVVDGAEKEFYSVSGKRIYPVLYNGSTYLPLRAIGELMQKDVVWSAEEKKVTLSGEYTVTDADSFNTDAQEKADGYIGNQKAKEIALDKAGLKAADVTFIRAKLDYDDGRQVYDVEFYSGNKEYDFEIDAKTGKILEMDYDVENWTNPSASAETNITVERAKEIALDHAGLKSKDVTFVRAKADWDDGRKVYEVEFYTDGKEYDYEIDANTGKILDVDYDAEGYTPPVSTSTKISLDQAKKIALDKAGVKSSDATFTKAKLDYDDGVQKYELEFRVGRMEYECEVHAETGKVLDYDAEYDD